MKKLILILMSLFFVAGCTPTGSGNVDNKIDDSQSGVVEPSTDVAGEVQPVMTSYDIYDAIPEELLTVVTEQNLPLDPSMLRVVGTQFPVLDMTDYNDETFNPSSLLGKKVVYEFVASWCGFCQSWTKDVMDKAKESNSDIEIIQIFGDGDKDAINEFYTGAGKEIGDKTVIPSSSAVETVMYSELGIYSFPTFIFVNEEGTIVWASSGYLDEEQFNAQLELAFGENNAMNMLGEDFVKSMQRTYLDVKTELYDETVAKIDAIRPENVDTTYYDYIVYSDLNKDLAFEQIVTMDGETVTWDQMKENKVLFNFIGASDAEDIFTVANNEVLKQIAEKYPDYTVVNFLLQYSEETVEDYYKNTTTDFTGYVVNTTASTMPESIYKTSIYMIPSLYFVNEQGRVAGVYAGELTMETFEAAKDLYFGETPVYVNK